MVKMPISFMESSLVSWVAFFDDDNWVVVLLHNDVVKVKFAQIIAQHSVIQIKLVTKVRVDRENFVIAASTNLKSSIAKLKPQR